MKKKGTIIILIIASLCFVYFIVDYFLVSPVYLYIGEVKNDKQIVININDGQGHYKFKKYELFEIEPGIYQLQGYGSLISGQNYPIKISIDNTNGQIQEIKQKNLDGVYENVFVIE